MKIFVKKLLNLIGWKLIKIKTRPATVHPYPLPTLEHIKYIMNCSGILHLGAHRGKEAPVYDWFNKKVLWIEAIPEIFDDLNEFLLNFYNQKAICALLGDDNFKKKNFFISNRDASCSSIFDFSDLVKNKILWRDEKLEMKKVIKLEMRTLDKIFEENNISPLDYNHWIIDLQGSELLALKGAEKSLALCKSIFIEISKKQYYETGSAKWQDIKNFLLERNFKLYSEPNSDHVEVLFVNNMN